MRPSLIPLALAAALLAAPAWSQPPASFLAPPSTAIPPSSDQAAPNAPLTLEQALSIAFERSPLLAAAREAAATEGELQQAGLLPNPSIDVSMDDRRKASRTTTTTLSMPIETGGSAARASRPPDWRATSRRPTWARPAPICARP